MEAVAAAPPRDGEVSGTEALHLMTETGVRGPVASVWADVIEECRARFEGTFRAPEREDGHLRTMRWPSPDKAFYSVKRATGLAPAIFSL